jgi:hypothetical protein
MFLSDCVDGVTNNDHVLRVGMGDVPRLRRTGRMVGLCSHTQRLRAGLTSAAPLALRKF